MGGARPDRALRTVTHVTPPRSLADDLRSRDDAALGRLLVRRPDLLHPVPSDLTALTTRATTGPSVSRCLDGFDALHLYVLRVASSMTQQRSAAFEAIAEQAAAPLVAATSGDASALDACSSALRDLVDAALVWGDASALHAVHAVHDLVASAPVPAWPRPVAAVGAQLDQRDVDAQAALHAREMLVRIRDVLDDWSVRPPAILRSGGLALRDFAGAARLLHSDAPGTALAIEVAHAARLVVDDHEEHPHWVPTDHYDAWLSRPPAEQWTEIVSAWLDLPRLPSLADAKTQVLAADRDRRAIPVLRRQVLDLLASMPTGATVAVDTVLAVLDDRQPRRAGDLRRLTVTATLAEATALGLTASGALSSAGRILLEGAPATPAGHRHHATRVAAALDEALPADVDHVLIQADLTMIAPGPVAADVARSLRLVADVESRGHATVYRIGEESIRRALDAGWDAAAVLAFLEQTSRTPVPQPLTYLIDDVARRHGVVRVGPALAYVRCDNSETLSALLADRRLATLGLSRIADAVLVSQSPPAELIAALRTSGYAPAAESPDGQVVVRRPDDRRTPAPRRSTVSARKAPEPALVTAAVRTLRAGDHAAHDRRSATLVGPAAAAGVPSLSSAAIMARLRQSITENAPVWIGYADTDGTITQQIVDPIRIAGGVLTAFDHRTEQVRGFSVSRVTGIADLPESGDAG